MDIQRLPDRLNDASLDEKPEPPGQVETTTEEDVEAGAAARGPRHTDWEKPSTQEWMIFFPLVLTSLMVSLDATVIITSLSVRARTCPFYFGGLTDKVSLLETIAQSLNANATDSFWVGTAYLLSCAVTMPVTASLSDIFGRPQCLTVSVAAFIVGTVLCATAQGIGVMLAGRSVQGIGGGGIIILSLVILTDVVPLKFRPRYVGIIQGAWAVGTSAGPVIGGALATRSRWRWIFYLMLPLAGVGLISVPLMVRLKSQRSSDPWRAKFARIDLVGSALFMASATIFLIALSRGGIQVPWSSALTVGPLEGGALGLVITVFWEAFVARDPFLKLSLFHQKSVYSIYAGAFAQGFLLYGQLYFCPLFFESVKLYQPLQTGVCLLPVMLTLTPASVAAGALITRWGSYRWAVWSGWALVTAAEGLTIRWTGQTAPGEWTVALVMLGTGHGLLLSALNCAPQAAAAPGDEGAAAAFYACIRSLGMAMGLGVSNCVFLNVIKVKLDGTNEIPSRVAAHVVSYAIMLESMPPSPLRTAIIQSYAYGFRGTCIFFCGFSGIALVVSVLVPRFGMNKELSSDHQVVRPRTAQIEPRTGAELEKAEE